MRARKASERRASTRQSHGLAWSADAACLSNLRADVSETTSGVDKDASVAPSSREEVSHTSDACEHVVATEHPPGTQITELEAPGASSGVNGLAGAMNIESHGRTQEQNSLDTRAAKNSTGQEHGRDSCEESTPTPLQLSEKKEKQPPKVSTLEST